MPKNASTCVAAAARAVGRAGLARRRIAGDAAAPGIGRLRRRAGPRIGERVAGRDVHHHERIERDLQPARLQLGDQMDDAGVRRRAAEGRPAVDGRDQMRGRARSRPATDQVAPGASPWSALSTPGLSLAVAGAQVVAEPGDDDRDALEIRADRLQLVERGHRRRTAHGRHGGSPARTGRARAICTTRRGLVAELGRARDQRDRAHHLLEPADRPHDLERQLRNAVAEIRRAAAARTRHRRARDRPARCLPSLATISGSGVWLSLPAIDAHGDAGEIERLAVGPDPRDAADRPLAQADREIGEIAVGRGGRGRRRRRRRPCRRRRLGARASRLLRASSPRSPGRRAARGRRRAGSARPRSRP